MQAVLVFITMFKQYTSPRQINKSDVAGSSTDMSRAGTTGHVLHQVTMTVSPGSLANGKTGKTSIAGWDLTPRVISPPLALS